MSRAWGQGSTRRWRKIRAQVLDRDGHRCRVERPGCTVLATHVHHVLGKAHGDSPALLVAACEHCNLDVGDPLKSDPLPRPRTTW